MSNISSEVEVWLDWRDRERRKHRTMTMREYQMWCRAGDEISCPSDSNAFPGGLAIVSSPR